MGTVTGADVEAWTMYDDTDHCEIEQAVEVWLVDVEKSRAVMMGNIGC